MILPYWLRCCFQELAETDSFTCSGVVSSLERGERPVQVGWLACPPTCQGDPSCLPLCCPPDHWFQGGSCQPATNHSAWIQHLEEDDFSLDWSGYSKGAHYCDPGHFVQVRFSFR